VSRPGAYGTAAHWPAIARLIRHSDRWLIAWHPGPAHWSAERVTGSQIRYLAAHSLDDLADAIGRAEAGQ